MLREARDRKHITKQGAERWPPPPRTSSVMKQGYVDLIEKIKKDN